MKLLSSEEVNFGERIGGGGTGVVYKGSFGGRQVAIKASLGAKIEESVREEFINEVSILSQLNHQNIVKFIAYAYDFNNTFFLMELCDTSLYIEIHVKRRALSEFQIVQYLLETANAMSYMHNQMPPVVHGDLKSHNLLIDSSGHIRLCDFGNDNSLEKVQPNEKETAIGLANTANVGNGTPSYMAPELFNRKNASKATDVYAFGMLTWELYSRNIPFGGTDSSDIRELVLQGHRPPISMCHGSRKAVELMSQCWHQESSERPHFDFCMKTLKEIEASLSLKSYSEALCEEIGDSLDELLR